MNPSDFLKQINDIKLGKSEFSEENLMAIMGSMLQGSDLSIEGLKVNHLDLCTQLAKFDLFSALRQIGALETVPELQKNGVRISILLHLAYSCCKGEKLAKSSDLNSWLIFLDKSPAQSQEDSPEDVFVGYICTQEGGFRVFPGVISHADFILERLLYFLIEKRSFPNFGEATNSIIELLKLSEAIANHLQLSRYFSVKEDEESNLTFPSERNSETHANAVTFTLSRLSELQIDLAKLSPFIIDHSTLKKLSKEDLQGSSIERFPLLEENGEIVVSSPALLCLAGIKFILETVVTMGSCADIFFEKESAEYFINKIIPSLGITPLDDIQLPEQTHDLPRLYAFAGHFDYGMPVLVLTQSSAITGGSNLEEFESMEEAQVSKLTKYLSTCCKSLERVEGFKGGIVLVALSSVGKPIHFEVEDLGSSWVLYAESMADWQTLSHSNEFDARRLWYFSLQEKIAKKAGVSLINMCGFINLYGVWKERDFTLIPSDMGLKKTDKVLMIDGAYAKTVNADFKNINDRHSCWHPLESRSFNMQRDGEGLNPDVSKNLKYVDHESTSNGILRGCISLEKNAWWIEIYKRPTTGAALDLTYKLWECLMNWCERIMLHMADRYPNLIPKELVIQLNLPEADTWDLDKVPKSSPKLDALKCQRSETIELISLTIEESFLVNFFQTNNTAERSILMTLVDSIIIESTTSVRKSIVKEVCENENVRFFHIANAQSLESVLKSGPAKPLFIPEEEFCRTGIGLAFKVLQFPPEKIQNTNQALNLLGKIVAKLQEDISEKLKGLAILPVVSHAFLQLDELSRDSSRFDLSMRALLALEGSTDWINDLLQMTKSRSFRAEIANRILIETACYSCVSMEQTKPSKTEILTILSEISVMIQFSEYRSAVANGLVEANLIIHPNGQIEFNNSFREEVMHPYISSRLNDEIQYHAKSYSDNFDNLNLNSFQDVDSQNKLEKFERAFIAEYGFNLESLNKIVDTFSDFAIKTNQASGNIDETILVQILKYGVGFTDEQIEQFLKKFVLPIRSSWDKELPKGCQPNDVFPWRFFRGLSVLIRPFVEVSKSPRSFIISATHLDRWRTYLLRAISNGELPDHIFESDELKKYLGSISHQEGRNFEEKVANEFINFGLNCRQGVTMRELGKTDADTSNDVDVVAWDQNSKSIFLIECKNLKRALTVAQAIQQLENFRGDRNNPKDYLTKHLNRVDWLQKNSEKLSQMTGISSDKIRWIPLLITSGRVPMSYCNSINFERDKVWSFVEIKEKLNHVK